MSSINEYKIGKHNIIFLFLKNNSYRNQAYHILDKQMKNENVLTALEYLFLQNKKYRYWKSSILEIKHRFQNK